MEYFLVVIMCIAMNCQTAWQEKPYSSKFECELASKQMVSDLSTTFPDSDGEVYCLTKSEYKEWTDKIENGQKPGLKKNHPMHQNPNISGIEA
jgi:outer membrane protein assembly factor BamB